VSARVEAIRRLAAEGLTGRAAAARLGMKPDTLRGAASRHRIRFRNGPSARVYCAPPPAEPGRRIEPPRWWPGSSGGHPTAQEAARREIAASVGLTYEALERRLYGLDLAGRMAVLRELGFPMTVGLKPGEPGAASPSAGPAAGGTRDPSIRVPSGGPARNPAGILPVDCPAGSGFARTGGALVREAGG
jgi:hypothetical protein